jgi:TPR repeat protein
VRYAGHAHWAALGVLSACARPAVGGDAGLVVVNTSRPCGDLHSCQAACDHGNGTACTLAGRYYEYADGVAQDLPRAATLYRRACSAGYLPGCYNAAVTLEWGRGVPRDLRAAAALYQRVCAGGSATACNAASRLAGAWPDGGRG